MYFRFPALAIPNKINKEEIELNLESPTKELNEEVKAIERPKDKEREKFKEREKDKEIEKDNERENYKNKEREKYKEKEKDKERDRSKERKHKKSKKHSNRSRSKSHSRSRSKSRNKYKNRTPSPPSQEYKRPKKSTFKEIEVGQIFDGRVTKVHDYGCFVLLENFIPKKEGLVHISNIKDKRITNAFEAVQRNQSVKVKIIAIAGSKISLSMKEVDQDTGEEIQKRPKNRQTDVFHFFL